jgi:DNA-binding response OmpR family regulator
MNKILLVEDDETLGYLLKEYLLMSDFDVHWTRNGKEGLQSFEEKQFDLALIDVMLPVMDGLTLLGKIKSVNTNFPVMLLTAKGLKVDKLKGFHVGADDYIVKPVEEEELVARIKAVLRRFIKTEDRTQSVFTIGNYQFQYDKRCLKFDGEEKVLSAREADLLRVLCVHKETLIESSSILKDLWGKNDYFNKKSMDVFIHKLRNRLKNDPDVKIVTVHNKGYILKTGI